MTQLTYVPGIDVSNWQGAFGWEAQRGKIGFGMAKATEGDEVTDSRFGYNWDGMWSLGHRFPRFAYSFFHPSQDPVVQAAHLVATVRGHGLLPGDNFVLDLETSDGQPPSVVASRARVFLQHVNTLAPGHRVLVYTSPSFAQAGNCAHLDPWFLWIAHYGVSKPSVPEPFPGWKFWQWSDQPLDLDRFNGTEADLLAFCRMPATR